MKRYVSLSVVFSVLLLFAATVSADDDNKQRNFNRFNKWGNSGGIADIISDFKNKHDDDKNDDDDDDDDRPPIDPGQGGGNDPQTNPMPPQRPGYVWVGDHWEREKAPAATSPQARPGYVWVGDHWEREKAGQTYPAGPMVVDPAPGTIVVRDHRQPLVGNDNSQASGGVTVTNTPIIRDHRTTGQSAPIIRDHRTPASVSGLNGVWTPAGPIVRDHRKPLVDNSQAPGGVTVTNTPIIRDHRGNAGRPRPNGNGGGLIDTLGDGIGNAGNSVGQAVGAVGDAVGDAAGAVGDVLGSPFRSSTSSSSKPNKAPASGWTVVRDHR